MCVDVHECTVVQLYACACCCCGVYHFRTDKWCKRRTKGLWSLFKQRVGLLGRRSLCGGRQWCSGGVHLVSVVHPPSSVVVCWLYLADCSRGCCYLLLWRLCVCSNVNVPSNNNNNNAVVACMLVLHGAYQNNTRLLQEYTCIRLRCRAAASFADIAAATAMTRNTEHHCPHTHHCVTLYNGPRNTNGCMITLTMLV